MPIPANAEEMRAYGYTFIDHGRCDACEKPVEWWRTPQRRQIPMNPMPLASSPARGHWSTCNKMVQVKKTGVRSHVSVARKAGSKE